MREKRKYSFRWSAKTGLKNKIIWAIVAVAVICVVWVLFIFSDMFGWANDGESVMVRIPEGCSVREMADILEREEIIEYKFAFRLYEKTDDGEHLFRQGVHRLDKGMSYGEIIAKLTDKPDFELDNSVKITIPEGFENRQIADKLAELGLVDREKFLSELEYGEFDYDFVREITRTENRLEGYLYPATYDILPGQSEHEIICKMLDAFNENIVPVYDATETQFSLDQVITFASMVEREAANDQERGIVASVFYNRMKKDMTLSSCATVQYIIKERKAILSNSDIKTDSPYNTYKNKGLPVGPIASPGLNSVEAVLSPDETDYLFFVAKLDGSGNVFSRTGEEHERKRKEIQGN